MATPTAKRVRYVKDVVDSRPRWNSSQPAQCPYCLVHIKQARNMNRHIKYYCQNAGNLMKQMIPKIELQVEDAEMKQKHFFA